MGQSIFSNVIIAAVSRVIVVLLGLLATALTVRIISVESFGAYSLVLTIGTFLQLFADFGLYLTASRELGAEQGRITDVMHHIVSLRITLLSVIFFIGLISFFFISSLQSLALLFVLLSVGLIFQSLSQLMMGVFQAYGSIWKATVGDIIGRVVQVVVLGYLFFQQSEGPLTGIAAAFTLGLFTSFVIHAILVPHRGRLFPKVSVPAWRYLVRTSWPIGLMLVLNVVYFRSDILILSFFRSAEEVGWYALAYKIIENGLFFPAMLGGLLLPHMSAALASHAKSRAEEFVSQGLTLALYAAIIGVTMLIMFSAPIIMFIAGSEFTNSVGLLQVLALALAIMFVGNIFGFTLIALSQQRKLAVLYGLLVVFNIGMNTLLVPRYGAVAAAWTTVATEVIAMFTASYLVYARLSYHLPVGGISLAFGGALISSYVGAILPASVHVGFRLAIALCLYAGIGYSLGLWNKKTLSILRTASSV
jgi:O-antigen/teichoic acid export membrane protein